MINQYLKFNDISNVITFDGGWGVMTATIASARFHLDGMWHIPHIVICRDNVAMSFDIIARPY